VFTLKQAGVDVLVTAGIGKFTALIIRDAANLAWKPIHIISKISASVGGVMIPAGPENATGIVSSTFLKDPTDLAWDGDPGVLGWHAFMAKYFPGGDLKDDNNVLGYAVPQTLVHVLMACGDDLSRDNIMRQASRLDHLSNPMLLPGITQSTSPTNYHPLSQLQMMRWTGRNWDRFGEIIEVENS
jgi:branched-chain amino acid transport system substrate-binding protein